MADTETQPSDQKPSDDPGPESLEGDAEANTPSAPASETSDASASEGAEDGSADKSKASNSTKPSGSRQLVHRLNIYLLLFGFVLLLAGAIILLAYLESKKTPSSTSLQTQSLTQSTLNQVANSDATVGSSQSVLNVESSAVFAGQVLARQNFEIAGNLQIGGTAALNDLSVSGAVQFGQVSIGKDLSVTGDTAIQGATTIAKSLQVNSSGTFSGTLSAPQVTTSSLQLNGDLVLNSHISLGGSTPSRSNGPALGGGGSVSVSGSDTGGSITINTGGSPAAGCFVTINFTAKYNSTPHVLVTPIGAAAGGLSYYVTRTTTSFSVCDAATPPAGSSFGFDYFVLD